MLNKAVAIIAALIILTVGIFAYHSYNNSYNSKKITYYSDENNYIQATGTVTHIAYDDTMDYVCIAFSDLSYQFSDNNFKISGENLNTVLRNGFAEKVQIGSTVSFMAAPRYFGDGYIVPIVALSVDSNVLLSFNNGMYELLDQLQ